MTAARDLTSAQRAALVILSLEEDVAAEVLRNLDGHEVRKLADVVDELSPIPHEALHPTLEEFERRLHEPVVAGGGAYVRKLAESALGREQYERLFAPPPPEPSTAIDKLRAARPSTLAELLKDEHPQVAAVILSQLPPAQASAVLADMPGDLQARLIARLASVHEIPAHALEVASEAILEALVAAGGLQAPSERAEFDGVRFAASLLNELPPDDSERLLEDVEEIERDAHAKIRDAMFTFEDLARLDSRSLQLLMREVSLDQLVLALRTAGEGLRESFFSAVSKRAAQTMREDLEIMPPKRLSEVEAAQREIVEVAMRMSTDGQLQLPGRGSEDMV